jgi:PAS domain S-box-containing protein
MKIDNWGGPDLNAGSAIIQNESESFRSILAIMDATLESIHNGILVVNRDGVVIKTNGKFAEMWQLSDEVLHSGNDNLLLQSIVEQVANPEEFLAKIRELYEAPDTNSLDLIYFRDGRIFERISKPMYIGDLPEGRVWSFLDVTERKNQKEAQRYANWRLESIIEGTHVGTWEWNVQTGETVLNEEWAKIIGYSLEELAPVDIKTWFRLAHPEDLKKSFALLKRHFAGELPYYNLECRMKHKDGSWVWILDRGRITTRTKEGMPLLMFGTHSDITIRKQVDEALQISENKANALINALPDLMFIINSLGVFIDYKAAREDLTYQTQSIIGKRYRDIMPPEFADLIDEKLKIALDTKEMQIFEYELPLSGKGVCQYEARMVPGRTDEAITIVRDLTERNKAEQLIKSKNELLHKINAEKEKFFSIIAHDLRGPLGGIMALAEMMADEYQLFTNAERKEMTLGLSQSARNVFNLLENLLEWSQMKRGNTDFNLQNLDLLVTVTDCLNIVAEPARGKAISLVSNIPGELVVFADKNMIQTVIRNLLSNAIKFTTNGGTVTISANISENNMIVIAVKDTGIGMSSEMLDHLFHIDANIKRPGTQGEPSTGLGLLLCKEFVEKNGGKLEVESIQYQGSVFRFSIPSVGQKENVNVSQERESELRRVKQINNLKILIAEDDEISGKLISLMLNGISRQVFRAKTGVEAVEICRKNHNIDLILMDMAMPEMTGYEATALIREFNTKVVILAQTTFASSADRELSLRSGCNDLIAKPFSKASLIELVKKYLK